MRGFGQEGSGCRRWSCQSPKAGGRAMAKELCENEIEAVLKG